MTGREEFLDVLRRRLRAGIPANPLRPVQDVSPEPIAYAVDLSDRVRAFEQAAAGVGAEVVRGGDGPGIVEQVARAMGVDRVAVAADPECAGVADRLQDLGVEPAPIDDVEALAATPLGVTGARAGVALTGSVVVDSSHPGARLASLLPEVHLALLPVDRIVPTPGDVLRRLADGPLSSNLVLITGPSRSADIELRLTMGVHGPRRVVVGLVEP